MKITRGMEDVMVLIASVIRHALEMQHRHVAESTQILFTKQVKMEQFYCVCQAASLLSVSHAMEKK